MGKNILGTEKISKLFIKFSIPAIISMIIAGTQTIVDGIFLGNYVGQNALASANLAQPFMQTIVGFSMIISVGSMSFIGRTLGEKDKDKAQNIFKTAFMLLSGIAVVIAIIGSFWNKKIALLLGANDVLLEGVSIYVKTISLFAPVMAIMFLFGFIDRLVGRPELYLKAMILSLATNICLNYTLVKLLGFGIQGAAYATGIAYLAALFMVFKPMTDRNSTVNIYRGNFDGKTIIPIAYNGSSEGVTSIAIATTAYVFNMAFMKIAGEAGVAAFTTISYVGQFGTLLMFGISDGITPILSYNYGFKKFRRLDSTLKLASKVNFFFGALLFLVLYFFGENLVSMFISGNREVTDMAVAGSKIYAFAFLISGFNIINSGYFTAIGDAKASIIIAASRGIAFIIIGIHILPLLLGMDGVWLTIPFAETITFLIGWYLVKRNSNLLKTTI